MLALAVVLTTAGYAAFRGLGEPEHPLRRDRGGQDAPDGTITKAEYGRALFQAVPRIGPEQAFPPDEPAVHDRQGRQRSPICCFSAGSRARRPSVASTVSESVVQDKLEADHQLPVHEQPAAVRGVPQAVALHRGGRAPARSPPDPQHASSERRAPEEAAESHPTTRSPDFYNANLAQFQQPETRDVRVDPQQDQGRGRQGEGRPRRRRLRGQLEEGREAVLDRPDHEVGRRPARAVAKGQSEPALDSAIFAAEPASADRPHQGPVRLLRDRGRGDPPGGDHAARRRSTPADPAAARDRAPAGRSPPTSRRTSPTSGHRAPSARRTT